MGKAKELFNNFKEMKVEDFKELYKALLAREIGLDEYTENADELMNEVLDNEYYRNDTVSSFIDEYLVETVYQEFDKNNFELNNWY